MKCINLYTHESTDSGSKNVQSGCRSNDSTPAGGQLANQGNKLWGDSDSEDEQDSVSASRTVSASTPIVHEEPWQVQSGKRGAKTRGGANRGRGQPSRGAVAEKLIMLQDEFFHKYQPIITNISNQRLVKHILHSNRLSASFCPKQSGEYQKPAYLYRTGLLKPQFWLDLQCGWINVLVFFALIWII